MVTLNEPTQGTFTNTARSGRHAGTRVLVRALLGGALCTELGAACVADTDAVRDRVDKEFERAGETARDLKQQAAEGLSEAGRRAEEASRAAGEAASEAAASAREGLAKASSGAQSGVDEAVRYLDNASAQIDDLTRYVPIEGAVAAIRCADTTCKVDEEFIASVRKQPHRLAAEFVVTPELDSAMNWRGVRLFSVRAGSIPDLLGLQAGDVILSVDDTALDGPEALLGLGKRVKDKKELDVAYERDEKPLRLHLSITSLATK